MKLSQQNIHNEFVQQLEEITEENIYSCYQCGKCSTGCPLATEMDVLPHAIIRNLQLGQEVKVLDSKTIWLCSTCLQCMTKCPQGIDVAKIMDSLREILKRKGVDKIDLTSLAGDFWDKFPQQGLVSGFRKYTS